jgi:alpha-D-ribose 1-methylphosphonate 5-triphosphate synthase subunit PhnL
MSFVLELRDVAKSFTLHLQGGVQLSIIAGVTFSVRAGECVVLSGPSGAGKSSILKMVFGNYRCDRGQILVRQDGQSFDVATAAPRRMLALRRNTIGYVSQFLRAVPRVPAIDVVAEPAVASGTPRQAARESAAELLKLLSIPEQLWSLLPATFSGGEQQRVNVARGFLPELPILLLDDPTASLDAGNCTAVQSLIVEKKRRGTAVVAAIHDEGIRNAIADRVIDVTQFAAMAASGGAN